MKYEMGEKRILMLDSQGDLAEAIRENIATVALSLPEIVVVKTQEEVVRDIASDAKHSLLIINTRDYNRESPI